jgi:hypothetical protein
MQKKFQKCFIDPFLPIQTPNIQKSDKPVEVVDAVARALVAALSVVTVAFGNKPPVASATVPTKSPLVACTSGAE